MMNVALGSIYVYSLKGYLTCKSYDMEPMALLPLRRKVCWGFLSPLKSIALDLVWTCEPWVQLQASHPLHHRGRLNQLSHLHVCPS
jgi:hypothetical protein